MIAGHEKAFHWLETKQMTKLSHEVKLILAETDTYPCCVTLHIDWLFSASYKNGLLSKHSVQASPAKNSKTKS